MRTPSLGQVWVLRVPKVGFGSHLVGCVRPLRPPPLLWSVFGPSSVRFFFSLALSGFARSELGVLVLVLSLFPVLFCVPRLASRLSNCHLILIVTSLPFPFHLHLHLICWSLKKPRGSEACVWTIWRDVKLLIWDSFSMLFVNLHGGHEPICLSRRSYGISVDEWSDQPLVAALFFPFLWQGAKSQEPHPTLSTFSTISCRGLHVCWNLIFISNWTCSLQLFDFKCADYDDGSFLILCWVSLPTTSCQVQWKCFCA